MRWIKTNYVIEHYDSVKKFISAVWESKGIIYTKDFVLEKKKAERIINKFSKKNGVLACYILDNKGNIFVSSIEESIEKSIEKKIIDIYRIFLKFVGKQIGSINFHDQIELVSFNEDPDFINKTYIMILKSIVNDVILLTIIPNKSYLTSVLPEYKKSLIKLHKCFKVRKLLVHI